MGKLHLSKKLVIAVLWPSFVGAGVFAGLLFAFVDPLTITHGLGIDTDQRLPGYSITFLVLWLLGSVVGFFAIYIMQTPEPPFQSK